MPNRKVKCVATSPFASPARAPFPILFSVASTLSPVKPTSARISGHRLKCESYGSSIDGCAINRSNHQAPIALPVASPARQPASGRSARALTVPSFASLSVAEWATCQWTQALTSRRSHAGERRVDKLGRHGRSQEPRLGQTRRGRQLRSEATLLAPHLLAAHRRSDGKARRRASIRSSIRCWPTSASVDLLRVWLRAR